MMYVMLYKKNDAKIFPVWFTGNCCIDSDILYVLNRVCTVLYTCNMFIFWNAHLKILSLSRII